MLRLLAVLLAATFALPALAQDFNHGGLHIGNPWSRTPPPNAPAAAVYFTLKNSGKQPDKLLSVSTPRAAEAMLHQNIDNNGVMQMRAAEAGIALPAGATVEFKPGGLHVMLMGIKQALQNGQVFPLTLNFARAGKVTVPVVVSTNAPG